MGVREWSDFVILVIILHMVSVVVTAPVWGIGLLFWATPRRRRHPSGKWERRIVLAVLVSIPMPLTIWAPQQLAATS